MILFCSNRPLGRAENITALWDAWSGEKRFAKLGKSGFETIKRAEGVFGLIVTDEFIPPVVNKKTCKTVMITHGIAGGKTYGLDQPRPYISRAHGKALDYIVAPSEKMRELMAQQCGVDINRVVALGMPRTDAYFTDDVLAIEYQGKFPRVYLYAPTYRNRIEQPYPNIDIKLLDDLLSDDEILLIKRHMVGGISKVECRHIFDVPSYEPTTPYLLACDVLITDYSSILFDAHVAKKPVVLFTKPNDRYLQGRGMYFSYPGFYASRYATNEYALIEICRTAFEPLEADIACRETTAALCDGQSVKRVIEFLEGLL